MGLWFNLGTRGAPARRMPTRPPGNQGDSPHPFSASQGSAPSWVRAGWGSGLLCQASLPQGRPQMLTPPSAGQGILTVRGGPSPTPQDMARHISYAHPFLSCSNGPWVGLCMTEVTPLRAGPGLLLSRQEGATKSSHLGGGGSTRDSRPSALTDLCLGPGWATC